MYHSRSGAAQKQHKSGNPGQIIEGHTIARRSSLTLAQYNFGRDFAASVWQAHKNSLADNCHMHLVHPGRKRSAVHSTAISGQFYFVLSTIGKTIHYGTNISRAHETHGPMCPWAAHGLLAHPATARALGPPPPPPPPCPSASAKTMALSRPTLNHQMP